jgi:serine/threonine protein phosphatase 1
MIKRLKSLFLPNFTDLPSEGLPDNNRLYAIGDIHGRYDLLQVVHRKILQHSKDYKGQITVVYLGDYVDRGPQSRQVVECLLSNPLPEFNTVYLLGNHEEILLQFLEGAPLAVAQDWLAYGGLSTLLSYGVSIKGIPTIKDLPSLRADFIEKCPPLHRQFYRNLLLSFELGGYFFVHAGIKPKLPLNKQCNNDLLWIRDEFLKSQKRFEKVIVHGHSVTEVPEIKPNQIGLDTGAFSTGRLTCAIFDGLAIDVQSVSANVSDLTQ